MSNDITIFMNEMQCMMVNILQRSGGTCCLYLQDAVSMKMTATACSLVF